MTSYFLPARELAARLAERRKKALLRLRRRVDFTLRDNPAWEKRIARAIERNVQLIEDGLL